MMTIPTLNGLNHVAIICSNYGRSKSFYCDILGGEIIAETYREARDSYKLDIRFPGFQIELFSFPKPPKRPSRPEAQGLRHLAMNVTDLDAAVTHMENNGVAVESIRVDELTGCRFTFFQDPDGLPLELVEVV
jgi:glyoxylase I family protein